MAIIYPNKCCTTQYLAGFTEDLFIAGYSATTILNYKRGVLHLGKWADLFNFKVVNFNDDILTRFRKHLKRCRCSSRSLGNLKPARLAANLFLSYLGREKIIVQVLSQCNIRTGIMNEFHDWMIFHKGITEKTFTGYERELVLFFSSLGEDPSRWDSSAIRSFVLERAKIRGRSEVKRLTNALRGLLRFLAVQRRCKIGLESAIPTIPQWSLSALPRYLEPNVLERVIASNDLSTANGLRDNAIIVLLARLGLRGAE